MELLNQQTKRLRHGMDLVYKTDQQYHNYQSSAIYDVLEFDEHNHKEISVCVFIAYRRPKIINVSNFLWREKKIAFLQSFCSLCVLC